MQQPIRSSLNEATLAAACEQSDGSAVAWPAIFAGAFTAAAISLILLLLGSGFGLAAVSPWAFTGVSAVTFTVSTAIWLIVMQWISSGLGGYLAGRLRTKWDNLHGDEVFFRDTAHGFLSWALATVLTAVFLASAVTTIVGGSAAAIASGAATQVAIQDDSNPADYWIDSLFRSDRVDASAPAEDQRAETARLFLKGVKNGTLSDPDKTRLTRLVAARTSLSEPEASQRVDEVLAQTRQEADVARKAGATASIFTFVSLLVGAFIASAAAALGGQHRDRF